MYVDASEACNELVFLLGDRAFDTDLSTRSWSVRVTQLECGSNNLAPAGIITYILEKYPFITCGFIPRLYSILLRRLKRNGVKLQLPGKVA